MTVAPQCAFVDNPVVDFGIALKARQSRCRNSLRG